MEGGWAGVAADEGSSLATEVTAVVIVTFARSLEVRVGLLAWRESDQHLLEYLDTHQS